MFLLRVCIKLNYDDDDYNLRYNGPLVVKGQICNH